MPNRKLRIAIYSFVFSALFAVSADAKDTKGTQPPPPAVPVPEVDQSSLAPLVPPTVEGTPTTIDGDRLKIGQYTVRIFGIAAPGISEKSGPDSRIALNTLIASQKVNCTIFGKTPDGDLLGQCQRGADDLGEKQLSGGQAAVYRVGPSPDAAKALDAKYDAAETTARNQGLGIWAKPAVAQAGMQGHAWFTKMRILGFLAFLLLILGIFAISITHISLNRAARRERARLRHARRYTLSTGLAAEVEIIRAGVLSIQERIKEVGPDRPIPSATGAALGLPTATFWNANAERLYVLPVEITVPLLRFHALHEDAVRKLAIASAVPASIIMTTLEKLAEAGKQSVEAIEQAMGIARKVRDTTPPPPKAENPTAS
ncbi:MAG TPA: thermonuclease family protein [Dongiaceae bacterium]